MALTTKELNIMLEEGIQMIEDAGIIVGNIKPKVIINKRSKRSLGSCRYTGARNDFTIQISHRVLDIEEDKVMDIVLHEILHSCPGCQNHGSIWQRHANTINNTYGSNITITANIKDLGVKPIEAKYILKCDNCDNTWKRHTRSKLVKYPEQYKCNCGGHLYLAN